MKANEIKRLLMNTTTQDAATIIEAEFIEQKSIHGAVKIALFYAGALAGMLIMYFINAS